MAGSTFKKSKIPSNQSAQINVLAILDGLLFFGNNFFPFSGKGFQQREDLKNLMKKSKTKKQQQTNYDSQILLLKAKRP